MLGDFRLSITTPWKQYFRTPAILWTQLAKSAPMRGMVVSNASGVYQLYGWDVPTGRLSQLTSRLEGIQFGNISPDGNYVYYLDDHSGNEIGHFVRVPFEGGLTEDVTPDLPPYAVSFFRGSLGIAISQAGNLLGCTLADPNGFHLYCLDLGKKGEIGDLRRLYHSKHLISGITLSHSGDMVVFASTERTGRLQFSLLACDSNDGQRIAELWEGPSGSLEPCAFSPLTGDYRLLAATNRTGVKRPLLWDLRTNERIDFEFDELDGEIVPLDWSPDGKDLLLSQFAQAIQHLYIYNLENDSLKHLQHPDGSLTFLDNLGTYFGSRDEVFAHWEDSTHPPRLIALASETGMQTRTVLKSGEVPASHPWKSITFSSSDGQTIQGWLGIPHTEGRFPTVLEMHGGPDDAMTERFSPESQTWLAHGFAYLTINYRGSTTFGRAFQEKIWGNPGHWEVEDMIAARNWLIGQNIAQPDQIFLRGKSYGGYLTLLALGKHPDLWAGGIAHIVVTDWAANYEDAAETLKRWIAALFKGTPQQKPEQYVVSSPITYIERVRAPVLIIQGRNDTRTPARQVSAYEENMQKHGKSIEVQWFDAGHLGPFAQVELAAEHQERMIGFAYRVLHKE